MNKNMESGENLLGNQIENNEAEISFPEIISLIRERESLIKERDFLVESRGGFDAMNVVVNTEPLLREDYNNLNLKIISLKEKIDVLVPDKESFIQKCLSVGEEEMAKLIKDTYIYVSPLKPYTPKGEPKSLFSKLFGKK